MNFDKEFEIELGLSLNIDQALSQIDLIEQQLDELEQNPQELSVNDDFIASNIKNVEALEKTLETINSQSYKINIDAPHLVLIEKKLEILYVRLLAFQKLAETVFRSSKLEPYTTIPEDQRKYALSKTGHSRYAEGFKPPVLTPLVDFYGSRQYVTGSVTMGRPPTSQLPLSVESLKENAIANVKPRYGAYRDVSQANFSNKGFNFDLEDFSEDTASRSYQYSQRSSASDDPFGFDQFGDDDIAAETKETVQKVQRTQLEIAQEVLDNLKTNRPYYGKNTRAYGEALITEGVLDKEVGGIDFDQDTQRYIAKAGSPIYRPIRFPEEFLSEDTVNYQRQLESAIESRRAGNQANLVLPPSLGVLEQEVQRRLAQLEQQRLQEEAEYEAMINSLENAGASSTPTGALPLPTPTNTAQFTKSTLPAPRQMAQLPSGASLPGMANVDFGKAADQIDYIAKKVAEICATDCSVFNLEKNLATLAEIQSKVKEICNSGCSLFHFDDIEENLAKVEGLIREVIAKSYKVNIEVELTNIEGIIRSELQNVLDNLNSEQITIEEPKRTLPTDSLGRKRMGYELISDYKSDYLHTARIAKEAAQRFSPEQAQNVGRFLIDKLVDIIKTADDLIEARSGDSIDYDHELIDQLKSLKTGARRKISTIKKTIPGLEDVGDDLAAGLKEGVAGSSDTVEAATIMYEQFLQTLKQKFQIRSPSGVTKYIGMMLTRGLAEGLMSELDAVILAYCNELHKQLTSAISATKISPRLILDRESAEDFVRLHNKGQHYRIDSGVANYLTPEAINPNLPEIVKQKYGFSQLQGTPSYGMDHVFFRTDNPDYGILLVKSTERFINTIAETLNFLSTEIHEHLISDLAVFSMKTPQAMSGGFLDDPNHTQTPEHIIARVMPMINGLNLLKITQSNNSVTPERSEYLDFKLNVVAAARLFKDVLSYHDSLVGNPDRAGLNDLHEGNYIFRLLPNNQISSRVIDAQYVTPQSNSAIETSLASAYGQLSEDERYETIKRETRALTHLRFAGKKEEVFPPMFPGDVETVSAKERGVLSQVIDPVSALALLMSDSIKSLGDAVQQTFQDSDVDVSLLKEMSYDALTFFFEKVLSTFRIEGGSLRDTFTKAAMGFGEKDYLSQNNDVLARNQEMIRGLVFNTPSASEILASQAGNFDDPPAYDAFKEFWRQWTDFLIGVREILRTTETNQTAEMLGVEKQRVGTVMAAFSRKIKEFIDLGSDFNIPTLVDIHDDNRLKAFMRGSKTDRPQMQMLFSADDVEGFQKRLKDVGSSRRRGVDRTRLAYSLLGVDMPENEFYVRQTPQRFISDVPLPRHQPKFPVAYADVDAMPVSNTRQPEPYRIPAIETALSSIIQSGLGSFEQYKQQLVKRILDDMLPQIIRWATEQSNIPGLLLSQANENAGALTTRNRFKLGDRYESGNLAHLLPTSIMKPDMGDSNQDIVDAEIVGTVNDTISDLIARIGNLIFSKANNIFGAGSGAIVSSSDNGMTGDFESNFEESIYELIFTILELMDVLNVLLSSFRGLPSQSAQKMLPPTRSIVKASSGGIVPTTFGSSPDMGFYIYDVTPEPSSGSPPLPTPPKPPLIGTGGTPDDEPTPPANIYKTRANIADRFKALSEVNVDEIIAPAQKRRDIAVKSGIYSTPEDNNGLLQSIADIDKTINDYINQILSLFQIIEDAIEGGQISESVGNNLKKRLEVRMSYAKKKLLDERLASAKSVDAYNKAFGNELLENNQTLMQSLGIGVDVNRINEMIQNPEVINDVNEILNTGIGQFIDKLFEQVQVDIQKGLINAQQGGEKIISTIAVPKQFLDQKLSAYQAQLSAKTSPEAQKEMYDRYVASGGEVSLEQLSKENEQEVQELVRKIEALNAMLNELEISFSRRLEEVEKAKNVDLLIGMQGREILRLDAPVGIGGSDVVTRRYEETRKQTEKMAKIGMANMPNVKEPRNLFTSNYIRQLDYFRSSDRLENIFNNNFAQELQRIEGAAGAVTSSMNGLLQTMMNLSDMFEMASNTGRNVTTTLSSLTQTAIDQLGQFGIEIDRNTEQYQQFEKASDRAFGVAGKAVSSFMSEMNLLMGGVALIDMLINLSSHIQNFTRQLMHSTVVVEKFEVLVGSFGKSGKKMIGELRTLADQVGVSMIPLLENYRYVALALQNTELSEYTDEIYQNFIKAAAAAQLTQEETGRILLAVGQIASKGRVSMEELQQQLGEALPGTMQAAAEAMSLSVEEFAKKVSEGRVSSEEFLLPFSREIATKNIALANKNATTLLGTLNRLENQSTETGRAFAQSFANMIKPIIEGLIPILRFIEKYAQEIMVFIVGLGAVITGKFIAGVYGAAVGVVKAFSGMTVSVNNFTLSVVRALIAMAQISPVVTQQAIGVVTTLKSAEAALATNSLKLTEITKNLGVAFKGALVGALVGFAKVLAIIGALIVSFKVLKALVTDDAMTKGVKEAASVSFESFRTREVDQASKSGVSNINKEVLKIDPTGKQGGLQDTRRNRQLIQDIAKAQEEYRKRKAQERINRDTNKDMVATLGTVEYEQRLRELQNEMSKQNAKRAFNILGSGFTGSPFDLLNLLTRSAARSIQERGPKEILSALKNRPFETYTDVAIKPILGMDDSTKARRRATLQQLIEQSERMRMLAMSDSQIQELVAQSEQLQNLTIEKGRMLRQNNKEEAERIQKQMDAIEQSGNLDNSDKIIQLEKELAELEKGNMESRKKELDNMLQNINLSEQERKSLLRERQRLEEGNAQARIDEIYKEISTLKESGYTTKVDKLKALNRELDDTINTNTQRLEALNKERNEAIQRGETQRANAIISEIEMYESSIEQAKDRQSKVKEVLNMLNYETASIIKRKQEIDDLKRQQEKIRLDSDIDLTKRQNDLEVQSIFGRITGVDLLEQELRLLKERARLEDENIQKQKEFVELRKELLANAETQLDILLSKGAKDNETGPLREQINNLKTELAEQEEIVRNAEERKMEIIRNTAQKEKEINEEIKRQMEEKYQQELLAIERTKIALQSLLQQSQARHKAEMQNIDAQLKALDILERKMRASHERRMKEIDKQIEKINAEIKALEKKRDELEKQNSILDKQQQLALEELERRNPHKAKKIREQIDPDRQEKERLKKMSSDELANLILEQQAKKEQNEKNIKQINENIERLQQQSYELSQKKATMDKQFQQELLAIERRREALERKRSEAEASQRVAEARIQLRMAEQDENKAKAEVEKARQAVKNAETEEEKRAAQLALKEAENNYESAKVNREAAKQNLKNQEDFYANLKKYNEELDKIAKEEEEREKMEGKNQDNNQGNNQSGQNQQKAMNKAVESNTSATNENTKALHTLSDSIRDGRISRDRFMNNSGNKQSSDASNSLPKTEKPSTDLPNNTGSVSTGDKFMLNPRNMIAREGDIKNPNMEGAVRTPPDRPQMPGLTPLRVQMSGLSGMSLSHIHKLINSQVNSINAPNLSKYSNSQSFHRLSNVRNNIITNNHYENKVTVNAQGLSAHQVVQEIRKYTALKG